MHYPLQGIPGVETALRVEKQGLYCCLRAELPRREGLWRVFLKGQRGTMPLGVLLPEGERMHLARRISCRRLEELGPLCCAYAENAAEQDWQSLPEAAAFFQKTCWKRASTLYRDCLFRPGQPRLLALPYDGRGPFPMTELFCFARRQTIRGREYVVYAFDGQDFPVFL